jgi:hypothetical protein
LNNIQGSAGALHLFQDVARLGGPDEWFRILVVTVDVVSDRDDQTRQQKSARFLGTESPDSPWKK